MSADVARLLRMPEVAAGSSSAVVSQWPVREGESFSAADAIVTVETDKAVVDVPGEADGVLVRTLVPEGTAVEVGAPIALLADPDEQVDDVDAQLAALGVGSAPAPAPPQAPPSAVSADVATAAPADAPVEPDAAPEPSAAPQRIFSSPLARRLARDAGLTIEGLAGSGPDGRIVRRDVEAAIKAASAKPASAGATSAGAPQTHARFVDTPHTRIRRATAARLTESTQNAPHFYVRGTARVDRLLRLRARVNAGGARRVSLNDFVVKAAARAHVLVPAMNVVWTSEATREFTEVDIAIAVATDRGLFTPVLRNVDAMPLTAVASTSADLAARARAGGLRQDDLEGGALTVTNLGMYGTEEFAAIINPPQSAILAVGAAREEPVARKGRLTVATVMHVTLSVDHRPVDGVVAAEWMRAFLSLLEDPVQTLV